MAIYECTISNYSIKISADSPLEASLEFLDHLEENGIEFDWEEDVVVTPTDPNEDISEDIKELETLLRELHTDE